MFMYVLHVESHTMILDLLAGYFLHSRATCRQIQHLRCCFWEVQLSGFFQLVLLTCSHVRTLCMVSISSYFQKKLLNSDLLHSCLRCSQRSCGFLFFRIIFPTNGSSTVHLLSPWLFWNSLFEHFNLHPQSHRAQQIPEVTGGGGGGVCGGGVLWLTPPLFLSLSVSLSTPRSNLFVSPPPPSFSNPSLVFSRSLSVSA